MRFTTLALAALLMTTQAMAQSGPPGGGNGGPPPGGRPDRVQKMQPLKRSALDKPVNEMFQSADVNHDGIATLDELRQVVSSRRDVIIQDRFGRIDSNGDKMISTAEFFDWQHDLGSQALNETALVDSSGPIAETIRPNFGRNAEGRMLEMVIEPLGALTIVQANKNYDAGLSLEELLAYERARFDKLDTDRNKELSFDELRSLNSGPGRRGPGTNGAGPPEGMPPPGGMPPCQPEMNCEG